MIVYRWTVCQHLWKSVKWTDKVFSDLGDKRVAFLLQQNQIIPADEHHNTSPKYLKDFVVLGAVEETHKRIKKKGDQSANGIWLLVLPISANEKQRPAEFSFKDICIASFPEVTCTLICYEQNFYHSFCLWQIVSLCRIYFSEVLNERAQSGLDALHVSATFVSEDFIPRYAAAKKQMFEWLTNLAPIPHDKKPSVDQCLDYVWPIKWWKSDRDPKKGMAGHKSTTLPLSNAGIQCLDTDDDERMAQHPSSIPEPSSNSQKRKFEEVAQPEPTPTPFVPPAPTPTAASSTTRPMPLNPSTFSQLPTPVPSLVSTKQARDVRTPVTTPSVSLGVLSPAEHEVHTY